MNLRVLAARRVLSIFLPALLAAGLVHAQPQVQPQSSDYIEVVVNSEPITHADLLAEVKRISAQLNRQKKPVPAPDDLRRMVLERMISDLTQLQFARETGVKVDETSVDISLQGYARQNDETVEQLQVRLKKEGTDLAYLRKQLSDQLILQRLREREIGNMIRISDQDVDREIQDQLTKNANPMAQEINLAQILISLPEKASAEEATAYRNKAQQILDRIRAGESFESLVQTASQADKNNDGKMGLRRADRYPELFVRATQKLNVGDVSEVVRSGAGFHILKVVQKKAPAALTQTVLQTRARHILLRTGEQLTQEQAIAKMAEIRSQLKPNASNFEELAVKYSQDSSASTGGDLGWALPGMFVQEFEDVMNQLAIGQVSAPFISRFGVHLMLLVDRRNVELSGQQMREVVRKTLRDRQYDDTYQRWATDIRNRAFVEYREEPR